MEIQFYNFPNIHSIPAQFPLNAFFLRFSYAYPTAEQSAVAASAYMSCSRMYNDYDGIQHDYTRKHGLI